MAMHRGLFMCGRSYDPLSGYCLKSILTNYPLQTPNSLSLRHDTRKNSGYEGPFSGPEEVSLTSTTVNSKSRKTNNCL